jgi:hypothetical protein
MWYSFLHIAIEGDDMEKIKSLIDFKFDKILTAKVIRVLYAVVVALAVIFALATIISGISESSIGLIILGPLGSLLYLLFFRLIFESLIVKFQMAQDIREIKNKYVSSIPPPPPTL